MASSIGIIDALDLNKGLQKVDADRPEEKGLSYQI